MTRLERMAERISKVDPSRITEDTVKLLCPWTPRWMARAVLKTAIRRGDFIRNEDGSARLNERRDLT